MRRRGRKIRKQNDSGMMMRQRDRDAKKKIEKEKV